MAIYEARGFSSYLYPYKGQLEPFDYIAQFKPLKPPEDIDIEEYKRTQALYCLSGKVTAEKNGSYKRNNASLVYRDLIFLDYDVIETGVNLPKIVSQTLWEYSYIIYPTIKHTPEKPRYRLVVKPNDTMDEPTYKQVVKEIADKIGLPFDLASLTWSQLQSLPVTTGDPADYQKIVEHGLDYPVPKSNQNRTSGQGVKPQTYTPRASGQRSITMRVIDTLFNGFGDEGGRNVALTRFVGLLFNKWVDCDIETAYELTKIANSVTANPLSERELDRTFESIARAEFRKRG
ncbi:TPA: primase alpha helix C-terminal domain-containing protein [Streptococcus pyogenes NGAS428]|nr:primase alpha helix C-terminal domain protein [Streptococcus pyogenes GA40468]HEQ9617526.1 primase alpha helix C-terminal domain-containing protein [Streptococcus pyogenes]HER4661655.1 primase alpha helix C-terminal domain-containing protein [Streptococcus pyogenes NGAS428]HER4780874.1 primase alpha helix C-terminal domain-containing protein [Streptococcus pyogenes NGAS148]HER6727211.1 primase alpha helix C-terminal domain-containing protein [Streptococcus pyogenes]